MSQTAAQIEAKARAVVGKQPTNALIDGIDLIGQPATAEAGIMRRWMIEELDRRNPAACAAWLDSDDASPAKYFAA